MSAETPTPPAAVPAVLEQDAYCLYCDYNLRGLSGGRCPECGREVDLDALRESRIPWVHRRRLGRCKAFWRTVRLATLPNKRFHREIARPVEYRDALRFRCVVLAHLAAAVFLAVTTGALMSEASSPIDWDAVRQGVPRALGLGAGWAVVAFVVAAVWTGLPSWFCGPRRLDLEQRHRAIALSYYLSAPLAWLLPLAVPLAGGMALAALADASLAGGIVMGLAGLGMVIVLIVGLGSAVAAVGALGRRSTAGTFAIGALLVLLDAVLPVILLGAPAALVVYWLLMYYSLT